MDDFYKEQIIDHYQNPRNFGELGEADVKVRESNASCGDLVEISIKFKSQNLEVKSTSKKSGVVEDVKFKGIGCAVSIASTSLLLEKIKQEKLSLRDVASYGEKEMKKLLGVEVTPTRMKCVMLPVRALKQAVEGVDKA